MTESTKYYCPTCGKVMESITQVYEFPHGIKSIVQVTCYSRKTCSFAGYTVSPNHANDAQFLVKYRSSKNFDVYTGEKIKR